MRPRARSMDRQTFMGVVAAYAAAVPLLAAVQKPALPVIGFLASSSCADEVIQ